ncbi:MAG: hypothetical protein ACJAS1_005314 [Oleiphilaceae bacterium]
MLPNRSKLTKQSTGRITVVTVFAKNKKLAKTAPTYAPVFAALVFASEIFYMFQSAVAVAFCALLFDLTLLKVCKLAKRVAALKGASL